MICTYFLAGANLENGDPDLLLTIIRRIFRFLPVELRYKFGL
jgi:hypothetical protein